MPGSTDDSGKPGVSRESEGMTPDAGPEEARRTPNGTVDEDLAAATEDPALSLKEPDSE